MATCEVDLSAIPFLAINFEAHIYPITYDLALVRFDLDFGPFFDLYAFIGHFH